MKSSSAATSARLIAFCVLSILGGTSVAMDETAAGSSSSSSISAGPASPIHNSRFGPLLDSRDGLMAGGKRAYTYRSEYKRLPVYQFGLGKRWAQSVEDKRAQPFSFGLGKRTRPYSFGLGKRSNYDDDGGEVAPMRLTGYGAFMQQPNELYEAYAQRDALENYLQGKRGSGFNFGLGKREVDMRGDEGLHEKLPVKHSRDKYLFGLGKRFYEDEEDEDISSQFS